MKIFINIFTNHISGCCYLLNPAMNPFLYSIFSKRFRRAFFDLLLKMNIRCFNPNNNEKTATVTTNRNKPRKQVINRLAILRHLDLRTSNGSSKSDFAENRKFTLNQENRIEKISRTTKAHSLHFVNDNDSRPFTKLYSEPVFLKDTQNINSTSNLKKYQTSVNLIKSPSKAVSFYLTPTVIDESSEYVTCKNVTLKKRENNYIYKVVFSGPGNAKTE